MPDYDRLLSQQRNVLLGSQQPTTREAIRAGIQSTTGTPYAENRSNIMAEKYNRALQGYGILADERNFAATQDQRQFERGMREREFSSTEEQRQFTRGMAERQFDAAEAQRMWTRAQAEADRGDENVQQLLELSEAYGANTAEAQQLAAAVIQRTEAENIEDSAALPGLVAEEAQKLGLQARPDLTLMSTAHGGIAGVDPMGEARTIVEGQPSAPSSGITVYDDEGNPSVQIGGNLPLTASHRSGMARDSSEVLRDIQGNLSEIENVMRTLQQGGPDAVGASGIVTRNVGAVVNQLANFFDQGDWVDTADAQRAKSELGSLFGRFIPTITAEEGGRYTEGDVNRAAGVLPASGNAIDIVNQSFGNVVIALETIGDIERRSEIREEMKLAGHPEWMDLTYESGRMQAVDRLKRQGMSGDEAIERIFGLVDEFNIPIDIRGIPERTR